MAETDLVFRRARKAIDLLQLNQLSVSSENFEFAVYYISHPASKLAVEVNSLAADGLRLTDDIVIDLTDRYKFARASPGVTHRKRTIELQAEELGALTSDAHDLTRELGRDIGAMVKHTDEPTSEFAVRLCVAERELAELRDELGRLRQDIGLSTRQAETADNGDAAEAMQHGALAALLPLVERARTFVLILFSVDNTESLKQRFGRGVMDNVLNAFMATLRQTFPEGEPIRWEINKFIIATPDLAVNGARLQATDVLSTIRSRSLRVRGTEEMIGTVTASAGISVGQGEPLQDVIDSAEANLLAAVTRGNCIEG
jgi:diguanylate cyclase